MKVLAFYSTIQVGLEFYLSHDNNLMTEVNVSGDNIFENPPIAHNHTVPVTEFVTPFEEVQLTNQSYR